MSLADLVRELVDEIEPRFASADHDPRAFSEIAHDVLTRARAHERVGLPELLAWLASDAPLPPQDLGSGFGEPPITLYADGRWALSLLAWVDGRTSVHEHDFAGAFTVLSGESLQRRYRFDSDHADGAPLRLGALTLLDLALLPQGAVSPIEPGPRLIHSVFHLARPTFSLVARTEGGLLEGPQYDFWGPHVALDPAHAEPRATRQTQTLALLVRSGLAWEPFAADLLKQASLHHTFRLVDLLVGLFAGAPLPSSLAELVIARHGEPALSQILASIAEGRWEHAVAERHAQSASEEHRFFLGALVCAPDRAGVLALVGARWPGEDPRPRVRRWITELVVAQDPSAPPSLLAVFDRAAAGLLGGEDPRATGAALATLPLTPELVRLLGAPETFLARLADGPLRALTR